MAGALPGAWGGVARARAQQGGRAPRFWCGSGGLPAGGAPEGELWLDPAEAGHAKTLRLRPGGEVELCDGRGGVQAAQVLETGRGRALVRGRGPVERTPWAGPRFRVAAALGSLQGGRAEFLVEKAAELGAEAVLPLITSRSDDVRAGRVERLRRVALSASKQSLRLHHLKVAEPATVAEVTGMIRGESQAGIEGATSPSPLALLAAQGGPPLATYTDVLRPQSCGAPGSSVPAYLLVGPEGDFTDDEVALFAEAGALPVGLGLLRLRVETAALTLLGGCQAQCDGVGGGDSGGDSVTAGES